MRSCVAQHGSEPTSIAELTEAIARAEGTFGDRVPAGVIRTGWAGVDRAIGGLRRGVLHEWLTPEPPEGGHVPPLGVLSHLAARAFEDGRSRPLALWIGSRRPYAPALDPALLARSVFVAVEDRRERLWAIDVALRSESVGAVIADAGGLDMRSSRRLQLAASVGRSLCLLARPLRERRELTAAWTRWVVTPEPTQTTAPRWALELLRCKGVQPTEWDARRWVVQRGHETGDVTLVPEAPDRRDPAPRPARVAIA